MLLSLRQLAFGALRARADPIFSLSYFKAHLRYAIEAYEPTTSWDPTQIIGQMVSLQVGHYLILASFSVVLLWLLSDKEGLQKDGGALCLAMLLDWHEWKSDSDWKRGWILATSWFITSVADTRLLSFLVRRPVLLLDHGSTLYILHLIFTIYYSQSVPQSLLWWITMTTGAAGTIILAEKACIDREMSTTLAFGHQLNSISNSTMEESSKNHETIELVQKTDIHDGQDVMVDIID